MKIILNFIYFCVGTGMILLVAYLAYKLINNYKEVITIMIKDRKKVENKFYYVLAILSLVCPFIVIFLFGFNPRTKLVCALSFPMCYFFLMKSMGLFISKKEEEKSLREAKEVMQRTNELLEKSREERRGKSKKSNNKKSTKSEK
jgi:choline-glycine betaine transporter